MENREPGIGGTINCNIVIDLTMAYFMRAAWWECESCSLRKLRQILQRWWNQKMKTRRRSRQNNKYWLERTLGSLFLVLGSRLQLCSGCAGLVYERSHKPLILISNTMTMFMD